MISIRIISSAKKKPHRRAGLRIKGINVNKQPCASLVRLFYGFSRREPRPSGLVEAHGGVPGTRMA
jgi:hypothetical protein